MSILNTLLPAAAVVFIITIGVILLNQHFRKNLYRQMLEQEELKNKYHYDLLRSSIEVQEVERKRIAHDLHDEIGALLTTSRIYFNQLGPGHSEKQLQQVSDKMNSLFDEMMANIRRISHDLRPVILENLGLVEAVESFHEKLSEAGVNFSFTHHFAFKITNQSELILYRIIQELIGNTLKHAHATHIFVGMTVSENRFHLTYKDNGIGFPKAKTSNGLGMKSIESRLNLINGKMIVIEQDKGIHFLMDIDIAKLTANE